MRSCLVTAAAVTCLVFVPPLFSQMTAVVSSTALGATTETVTFSIDMPRDSGSQVITGAPYSGRRTRKSVQTLADGTTLTHQMPEDTTWRDSMGRVRTERLAFPGLGRDEPMADTMLVEIFDVVAGYRYFLDPVNHIARRAPYQPRQVRSAGALGAVTTVVPSEYRMPDGTVIKTESLGTQIISGVTAIGRRNTNIYPTGSRMGNDRPVTTVNESWTAPQLGVTLLSKNKNLDRESTMAWEDFSTSEPDPVLFQIPAGYQIVDETGPFKVVIRRQK